MFMSRKPGSYLQRDYSVEPGDIFSYGHTMRWSTDPSAINVNQAREITRGGYILQTAGDLNSATKVPECRMEVVIKVIAIGAQLLEPRIRAKLRSVERPPSHRTQVPRNVERVGVLTPTISDGFHLRSRLPFYGMDDGLKAVCWAILNSHHGGD
jgi:hypothetical protein